MDFLNKMSIHAVYDFKEANDSRKPSVKPHGKIGSGFVTSTILRLRVVS